LWCEKERKRKVCRVEKGGKIYYHMKKKMMGKEKGKEKKKNKRRL